MRKAEFNS
ncbi:hypothetical protein D043_5163A, partial [Vibrio parahaemolyticus EKP-021]